MKCNRTKLYFLKSNEKSFCIQLDFINFFYKIGMRTFWRLEFKVIISKPYCDVILIVNAVLVLYPSVIFYPLPKGQVNQRISFKFKGIVLRTIILKTQSIWYRYYFIQIELYMAYIKLKVEFAYCLKVLKLEKL